MDMRPQEKIANSIETILSGIKDMISALPEPTDDRVKMDFWKSINDSIELMTEHCYQMGFVDAVRAVPKPDPDAYIPVIVPLHMYVRDVYEVLHGPCKLPSSDQIRGEIGFRRDSHAELVAAALEEWSAMSKLLICNPQTKIILPCVNSLDAQDDAALIRITELLKKNEKLNHAQDDAQD